MARTPNSFFFGLPLSPTYEQHASDCQHFLIAHQESDIEYSISFWVRLDKGASKVLCHLVLNHVEPLEIFSKNRRLWGTPGFSKMDEFPEKLQTDFDRKRVGSSTGNETSSFWCIRCYIWSIDIVRFIIYFYKRQNLTVWNPMDVNINYSGV